MPLALRGAEAPAGLFQLPLPTKRIKALQLDVPLGQPEENVPSASPAGGDEVDAPLQALAEAEAQKEPEILRQHSPIQALVSHVFG